MTDISTDTVIAVYTGGVARGLNLLISDSYNLKNLGALMNGTSGDATTIQSAYSSLVDGSNIDVPGGYFAGLTTPSTSKSILWSLLEPVYSGTSGMNSFGFIGDGDVTRGHQNFNTASYGFGKEITNSTEGRSVLDINFYNNNSSARSHDIFSALTLNGTTNLSCSGFYYGLESNLYSNSFTNSNQELAIAANVQKTGQAGTWQFFGQTNDLTGLPPSSFGDLSFELDMFVNGYDYINATNDAYWNPTGGSRMFFYLRVGSTGAGNPDHGSWSASTAVTAASSSTIATVIYSNPKNGYVYVCTTSGTTGASQPAWPTAINATVDDGTAVWKCGTQINGQVSRGIQFNTDAGCSFGAGICFGGASFTDACIDTVGSNYIGPNSFPIAIRIQKGTYLDLGSDGPAGTQGQYVFGVQNYGYGLAYFVNGVDVFNIADNGVVTIPNQINMLGSLNVQNNLYSTSQSVAFSSAAPSSGTTQTINLAQEALIITSAALSSLTINFSNVPTVNGQLFILKFSHSVTSLTFTAPTGFSLFGAPTSIPSGGGLFNLVLDVGDHAIFF